MKLFFSLIPVLFCSSCISSTIAGNGKKYSHLESRDTARQKIIEELGEPIYSSTYQKPVKILNTNEYKREESRRDSNLRQHNGVPPIPDLSISLEKVLSNGDKNNYVKYCDVYSCNGGFHFQGMNSHYDMPSAMTLGIADIIMIPSAIGDRLSKRKVKDYITIWYDENMKYQATARGNLKNESESP